MNNDAYICHKTWNKYDYYNAGKKKKPANEWIVSATSSNPFIFCTLLLLIELIGICVIYCAGRAYRVETTVKCNPLIGEFELFTC